MHGMQAEKRRDTLHVLAFPAVAPTWIDDRETTTS